MVAAVFAGGLLGAGAVAMAQAKGDAKKLRFITLAPGHFHAALVQKSALPNVDPVVHVYAPLGFDLTEHVKRVVGFNTRAQDPTNWQLEIHTGPDFLQRMQKERPGNIVVISGKNRGKIELIQAAIDAGLHVLVDKPWVIEAADIDKLKAVMDLAARKKLLAYDIMTERFEATNALQRELVRSPGVFGELQKGSPSDPAVYIEDVHHYMKVVSGRPNIRPTWYFDSREQGEGVADTGTHLVDLVQWTVMPDKAIDFDRDVKVLAAQRWPTRIKKAQFMAVTGTDDFPASLADNVKDGVLDVFSNTQVSYAIDGVHVQAAAMWDWQAAPGAGDWKYVVYRGTKSRVEARQGRAEKYRPEIYVVPETGSDRQAIRAALEQRLTELSPRFPGLAIKDRGREFQILIPEALRTGHEAHFAEVTRDFLRFLDDRKDMPSWEAGNLITKYRTTTAATLLSRQGPPRPLRRRAPR